MKPALLCLGLSLSLLSTAQDSTRTQHDTTDHEEVIITTTRSSRSIRDIATRVETISGEELEEKSNMKPGDIRMLLNESTGIQTQQTSAVSQNSSIRIQGLDGRYTQLLRDGLPLYSGYSGGLSLMQVPPLDLKQVEVIKGSSSTLYGGGAIAGLVNLVSKTPGDERELNFLGNATTAGGLDLSGFYSQRFNKLGLTFFGSRNSTKAYDPADIGFSAIPESERYTIHPRLFYYGNKLTANAGLNWTTENRTGGSMNYIKQGANEFYEFNRSRRLTAYTDIRQDLGAKDGLQVKASYNRFRRRIEIPNYRFEGLQLTGFSELNYHLNRPKTEWIIGANFNSDAFRETPQSNTFLRNYRFYTTGIFLQNTWTPNESIALETGLRGDYTDPFGFVLLPRFSLMLKASPAFTMRIGGGWGYKTPTIFNEDAERDQFQYIRPLDPEATEYERSAGGNVDFNYRKLFGDWSLSVNQLIFYTRLNDPLERTNSGTGLDFINADGYIETRGGETNIRLGWKDFKLFVGYTYADVNRVFNGDNDWFPLTARHRLNNVLMWEQEEKWKLGLEAYYFSPQKLRDGQIGKDYWICGFMAERLWERFSLFANFENLFDTRQTRFDTIFTGTTINPTFRDIYAPVDGFVVNGGVKIRL